ncbi:hypothetical protein [Tenacibaculum sp. 190524A05c]|uniref:hypothetical protein n=1 Tax=Tenacibaculum platacis TaxID=3137852 RepID=UPI0031FB9CB6
MKKNTLKNFSLIILIILTLVFSYSLFEKPDNIVDNVVYSVNPKNKEYQIIHTTKTKGTYYTILAKFNIGQNNKVESVKFKLANFGGIFHYSIEKVEKDEFNDFIFYLNASYFSKEKDAYELPIKYCNYNIDNRLYDNHIKINFPFPLKDVDETSLPEKFYISGEEVTRDIYYSWCCGRQCKYEFTLIEDQ